MNCNHTNSRRKTGTARRKLRGVCHLALSGLLLTAAGGMLAGCTAGGTISGGNVPEVAFAMDPSTSMVSVFAVDATTGAWTATGSAMATGIAPLGIAVHPSGKFLYAASAGSFSVLGYTIDAQTGALGVMAGSPFGVGAETGPLTIDTSGNFLYAQTLNSIFVPPTNNMLLGLSINAMTGALTPVAQPHGLPNTTFVGLAFDPATEFLYGAELSPANDVQGFAVNAATGVVASVPGSPFTNVGSPFGVAGHPSGKFLYVTNSASNEVTGYSVDAATGRLTAVLGSPFPAGTRPTTVVVEPIGQFLYVVNNGSGDVSAYSIDAMSGVLTQLPGSPFPSGAGAQVAGADPTGNFLYVVNATANNISVFLIRSNGALTPMGTMLSGAGNVSGIAFRAGHP